jgi:hypothetical protein
MTPAEFITTLFGAGWTEDQLPVFANMISAMQEDALRYHEIREVLCRGTDWVASRADLTLADKQIDNARNAGLL